MICAKLYCLIGFPTLSPFHFAQLPLLIQVCFMVYSYAFSANWVVHKQITLCSLNYIAALMKFMCMI